MEGLIKKYKLPIIIGISILTFICFNYTIHNQFTNWDDDFYVTNDPYIKALTPENLKIIFTEDITKNNYHPFCMLSLAINYYFSQLNPAPYYITNIFIHIGNVLLVFYFFLMLSKRLKVKENGQVLIASFGALWFGIHPMHVESVAWIAERKDVLYCFFYVAGLITYLKFLESRKAKWYAFTLLLFVASCLSKPMAVVFPLSLLCLDVLLRIPIGNDRQDKSVRRTDSPVKIWARYQKIIIEKIPFFLISLVCGGFAFYTQNKTGAVAAFSTLTLQERVMYAAFGFIQYVKKFFLPLPDDLSTFYPYPYRYITGWLPWIYYAAPFIALAILAIPFLIKRKKYPQTFRVVLFGIGYLFCNLVFVLQFISVGAAIMADRYSYVAYIGPLFLIPYLIYLVVEKFPSFKTYLVGAMFVVSGILSIFCYQRTYAWHDAESLLSDAIAKYPYRALLSYKWLGHHYFDIGDYDKALENYNVLISLRAADKKVEDKVAAINVLKSTGGQMMPGTMPVNPVPQQDNAVDASFQKYLDSSYYYCRTGDSLKAFRCYIMALRFNHGVEKLYADSSFKSVQSQHFTEAINQYDVLLKLNSGNAFYYFYRGVAKFSTNRLKDAIPDWEIAVKMDVKDVQMSASYNLSVAYDSVGKDSLAAYYIQMAKAKGYGVAPDFYTKIMNKYTARKKK